MTNETSPSHLVAGLSPELSVAGWLNTPQPLSLRGPPVVGAMTRVAGAGAVSTGGQFGGGKTDVLLTVL